MRALCMTMLTRVGQLSIPLHCLVWHWCFQSNSACSDISFSSAFSTFTSSSHPEYLDVPPKKALNFHSFMPFSTIFLSSLPGKFWLSFQSQLCAMIMWRFSACLPTRDMCSSPPPLLLFRALDMCSVQDSLKTSQLCCIHICFLSLDGEFLEGRNCLFSFASLVLKIFPGTEC